MFSCNQFLSSGRLVAIQEEAEGLNMPCRMKPFCHSVGTFLSGGDVVPPPSDLLANHGCPD